MYSSLNREKRLTEHLRTMLVSYSTDWDLPISLDELHEEPSFLSEMRSHRNYLPSETDSAVFLILKSGSY